VVVESGDSAFAGRIIRSKTSNSLQPGSLSGKQTRRLWLTGLPCRRFVGSPHACVHGANNQGDDCLSGEQG